ncbi:MAG TPA: MCP four helix bundle domain-containing protein, partial [Roseateles sp.]
MFSNIKIGLRLTVAFLLVAAASVVVGVVGIQNTAAMSEHAERMYGTELMGLSYIKEANIDLIYVGRARSNFMLAQSAEQRTKQLDTVNQSFAMMKDNIGKARPMLVSERGKQLLASVTTAMDSYEHEIQALLAEAGKRKMVEHDETLDRLSQSALAKAKVADDLLTDLSKLKEERAKEAAEETAALYARSRTVMVGTMVAALLGGVLLGIVISRGISKPLAQAVDAANKLAEGDLSVRIDAKTTDEVGQLMQAMHHMVEKLSQVVAEVNSGAEALAGASEEVSATAQSLSQAASEQAAGVEETSASIEQMTASIAQNTE